MGIGHDAQTGTMGRSLVEKDDTPFFCVSLRAAGAWQIDYHTPQLQLWWVWNDAAKGDRPSNF